MGRLVTLKSATCRQSSVCELPLPGSPPPPPLNQSLQSATAPRFQSATAPLCWALPPQEPHKQEVLAALRGGAPRPARRALTIAELPGRNTVVESVVELGREGGTLVEWKEVRRKNACSVLPPALLG